MDKKSLALVALGLVIGIILTTSALFFQQIFPAQQIEQSPKQAPILEKFKVSGYSANVDVVILLINAGEDRSIWSSNGLAPEFIFIPGRVIVAADLKQQVESGVKVGISASHEVLSARSTGLPLKVVASLEGETLVKIFVKPDGSIKAANDLDGKRIGVRSANDSTGRAAVYFSNKFAIKPQIIPLGNLTNNVVALKLGRIDAFVSSEGAALRLVDSGELGLLSRMRDVYPKPWVGLILFATEDVIVREPDLVKRFVRATLETIKYLKENPQYAADMYIKSSRAPRDLALRVTAEIPWSPSGHGGDLMAGVTNSWRTSKEVGAVPASTWEKVRIEDAVDLRFLP